MRERGAAVAVASWVWRAATVYTAHLGGLVSVKEQRSYRRAQSSPADITAPGQHARKEHARTWVASKRAAQATKYLELLDTAPDKADAYLSKLTKGKGVGLPDLMHDPAVPGNVLSGPAVVEGAARYIADRASRRRDSGCVDVAHCDARERHADSLAAAARAERSAGVLPSFPYTMAEVTAADDRVRMAAKAADLPYAALKAHAPGYSGARLAVQNMARYHTQIPARWGQQPTYHTHKDSRNRRNYASYRTLSLSNLELRTCEELWAARNVEFLWMAAGPTQLGRADPRITLYVDIEVVNTREALGLPTATLDLDLEEAHDTASRAEIVARMPDSAGVGGEELCLAEGLLEASAVSVHVNDVKSRVEKTLIGIPEGRVLASGFFAVGATLFPEMPVGALIGVGIDPDPEAVLQYHLASRGPCADALDVAVCQRLAARVASGDISWAVAMSDAAQDANRLCLVDLSAPTRIGLTQFMDDTKLRCSSWGGLNATAAAVTHAVSLAGARIKNGASKTAYRERNLNFQRSVQCGQGDAERVEVHVSLGAPLDSGGTMAALMAQVETRGRYGAQSTLVAMELLGMPLAAALRAWDKRVVPRCLYAAEFLLVRRDWKTRVDALQDFWLLRTLGLCPRVPRLHLHQDLGVQFRLSSVLLLAAMRLIARIDVLEPDHMAAAVRRAADNHGTTWTAAVREEQALIGAPRIVDWLHGAWPATPQQRKAKCRAYSREVLTMAVQRAEDQWREQEEAARGPAPFPRTVDYALWGCTMTAVRGMAQLRLQGFLTELGGGHHQEGACPFCGGVAPAGADHLLRDCVSAAPVVADAIRDTPLLDSGPAEIAARFAAATEGPELRAAMIIAAALRRAA